MALPAYPLDVISDQLLSNEFALTEQATSLATTANGCYIIAGFSSGTVRIYNGMSGHAHDKHGTIVGHIAAKGLHTNLLLQVGVSEDCRFAFAGVMRGSAQMLAFDLSYLPTWSTYDRKSKLAIDTYLRMHAHSDAKLKGFGAATRLLPRNAAASTTRGHADAAATPNPNNTTTGSSAPSAITLFTPAPASSSSPPPSPPSSLLPLEEEEPQTALVARSSAHGNGLVESAATPFAASSTSVATTGGATTAEYLLICGRGIKNIHIWSFSVPLEPGTAEHKQNADPVWTLIHDIPTNGMTIELIGFRDSGLVAFSKSKGYGLRLWDLHPPAATALAKSGSSGSLASSSPLSLQLPAGHNASAGADAARLAVLSTPSHAKPSTSAAAAAPTPVATPVATAVAAATPATAIQTKIVHREVANSSDVLGVAGGFAFGGEYGLSVIKLHRSSSSSSSKGDASSSVATTAAPSTATSDSDWASRSEVALPDLSFAAKQDQLEFEHPYQLQLNAPNNGASPRSGGSAASSDKDDNNFDGGGGRGRATKKRRCVRAVQKVLPSEDAEHVLLLCSDGTCLHYANSAHGHASNLQAAGLNGAAGDQQQQQQQQMIKRYRDWQASEDHTAVAKLCAVPGNLAVLIADWTDRERFGTLRVSALTYRANNTAAAAVKEKDDKPDGAAVQQETQLGAFWGREYVQLWPVGLACNVREKAVTRKDTTPADSASWSSSSSRKRSAGSKDGSGNSHTDSNSNSKRKRSHHHRSSSSSSSSSSGASRGGGGGRLGSILDAEANDEDDSDEEEEGDLGNDLSSSYSSAAALSSVGDDVDEYDGVSSTGSDGGGSSSDASSLESVTLGRLGSLAVGGCGAGSRGAGERRASNARESRGSSGGGSAANAAATAAAAAAAAAAVAAAAAAATVSGGSKWGLASSSSTPVAASMVVVHSRPNLGRGPGTWHAHARAILAANASNNASTPSSPASSLRLRLKADESKFGRRVTSAPSAPPSVLAAVEHHKLTFAAAATATAAMTNSVTKSGNGNANDARLQNEPLSPPTPSSSSSLLSVWERYNRRVVAERGRLELATREATARVDVAQATHSAAEALVLLRNQTGGGGEATVTTLARGKALAGLSHHDYAGTLLQRLPGTTTAAAEVGGKEQRQENERAAAAAWRESERAEALAAVAAHFELRAQEQWVRHVAEADALNAVNEHRRQVAAAAAAPCSYVQRLAIAPPQPVDVAAIVMRQVSGWVVEGV